MKARSTTRCAAVILLSAVWAATQGAGQSFVGFDRNDYPGDGALAALHKDFRYVGYWLNHPPGEQHNSWVGKRALLSQHGFGFLVLFNGRLYAELKGKDPAVLGTQDGRAAVASARREGFGQNVLIFLDQEEGGRLLEEQATYLFAWVDAVRVAGGRAGVYCSGIDVTDGSGTINTAKDILQRNQGGEKDAIKGTRTRHGKIALWIANDTCPPSPGCVPGHAPPTAGLGGEFGDSVVVWQYALSPRRAQFAASCPRNYAADGNCYAPGLAPGANSFLDLDVSRSSDPSESK